MRDKCGRKGCLNCYKQGGLGKFRRASAEDKTVCRLYRTHIQLNMLNHYSVQQIWTGKPDELRDTLPPKWKKRSAITDHFLVFLKFETDDSNMEYFEWAANNGITNGWSL